MPALPEDLQGTKHGFLKGLSPQADSLIFAIWDKDPAHPDRQMALSLPTTCQETEHKTAFEAADQTLGIQLKFMKPFISDTTAR